MTDTYITAESILPLLMTRRRALSFIDYLASLEENFYRKEELMRLNDPFSDVISVLDKNLLSSSDSLRSFLDALKRSVDSVCLINMTIATTLDLDALKDIYLAFEDLCSKPYLLDLKIDPSIIGGAEVVLNGKYVDLTLNTYIDNLFSTKKDDIKSILHS